MVRNRDINRDKRIAENNYLEMKRKAREARSKIVGQRESVLIEQEVLTDFEPGKIDEEISYKTKKQDLEMNLAFNRGEFTNLFHNRK